MSHAAVGSGNSRPPRDVLGRSGALNTASGSLSFGYKDIASIHIQPVPEGPASPSFRPKPRSIDEQPLALLRDLVPDPPPRPSDQPVNCNGGGDLIIDLKNGGELTYGPCRWPWQISELWSAMIEVSDVTESNLILPNTPALAEEEQVRQALAVAIQRSRIRRKARFAPRTITCRPALTTPRGAPIGYHEYDVRRRWLPPDDPPLDGTLVGELTRHGAQSAAPGLIG